MQSWLLTFTLLLYRTASALASVAISHRLHDAMVGAVPSGAKVTALVVLRDQADIAGLNSDLSRRRVVPEERAYTIITALQDIAFTTQSSLLSYLNSRPSQDLRRYQSFWIL